MLASNFILILKRFDSATTTGKIRVKFLWLPQWLYYLILKNLLKKFELINSYLEDQEIFRFNQYTNLHKSLLIVFIVNNFSINAILRAWSDNSKDTVYEFVIDYGIIYPENIVLKILSKLMNEIFMKSMDGTSMRIPTQSHSNLYTTSKTVMDPRILKNILLKSLIC